MQTVSYTTLSQTNTRLDAKEQLQLLPLWFLQPVPRYRLCRDAPARWYIVQILHHAVRLLLPNPSTYGSRRRRAC